MTTPFNQPVYHDNAVWDRHKDKIAEFIRKRQIAQNELTENQMAELIMQMAASGDLYVNILKDTDVQSVVYVPFRDVERLRSRIATLELTLKEHGIEIPNNPLDDSR